MSEGNFTKHAKMFLLTSRDIRAAHFLHFGPPKKFSETKKCSSANFSDGLVVHIYAKLIGQTAFTRKAKYDFAIPRFVYPVRKYPLACQRVILNFTNTGVNTPCEFSNGIFLFMIQQKIPLENSHGGDRK